ncbi:divergent polysaccharide deacetylase family protein [Gilvimarinus agarilyticus]|uniref:divergent polysaccharide deacetylase family protein n=1 Tax=Gilvimarinus agarilyticus TaxID=679259 RepID=UPI0006975362|nr:divergent polysaccharide deacetylase family protein [Gilvimarinus agarilyticus]
MSETRFGAMLARMAASLLLPLAFSAQAVAEPDAKLAIIIDDIGYNLSLGRRTAVLKGAYTLALLPLTPHSRELATFAHTQGKELILHAPMANQRGLPLGPGALELGMPRDELLNNLRHSLMTLPEVVGVNNHMGSALTEHAQPMGWIMGELERRDLFFVDSRTTSASVAGEVAKSYGLRNAERDVFLDHVRDPEHIRQQLVRAIELARQRGSAIAIGHPYPETLEVLEQAGNLLAGQSVRLVSVSQLTRQALAGSGSCPLAPNSLRDYRPPNRYFPVVLANSRWWSWGNLINWRYQPAVILDKHGISKSG